MGIRKKEPEPDLVKRAKKGEPRAFAILYEQIYLELYKFALYMMTHRQDAEDAVSEAVIAAYENISGLRSEEAFRGWMFRILTNVCRKKLKLRSSAEQELKEEIPAEAMDYEEAVDVREAFACLAEEERAIVSLTVFGGYTSRELEQLLGIKAATIRSRRSRALGKMEAILEHGRRRD
ncbi:MAG TPA: RNA polymerase subunit sigma-70 [Lachnospiraceae bacterium]|nr:RNA polymerase subunit sigma-70 [Lachnospiraceae bacterium]